MLYCRHKISKTPGMHCYAEKLTFSQLLAQGILKLVGWEATGSFPNIPKFILVGAPHTSNWDFPLDDAVDVRQGRAFPLGRQGFAVPVALWRIAYHRLGGIPVQRDAAQNFVQQIVTAFEHSTHLIIAICSGRHAQPGNPLEDRLLLYGNRRTGAAGHGFC